MPSVTMQWIVWTSSKRIWNEAFKKCGLVATQALEAMQTLAIPDYFVVLTDHLPRKEKEGKNVLMARWKRMTTSGLFLHNLWLPSQRIGFPFSHFHLECLSLFEGISFANRKSILSLCWHILQDDLVEQEMKCHFKKTWHICAVETLVQVCCYWLQLQGLFFLENWQKSDTSLGINYKLSHIFRAYLIRCWDNFIKRQGGTNENSFSVMISLPKANPELVHFNTGILL